MADVPQTWAQWAAYGGAEIKARAVLNTLIANDPFLGMVPILPWPGGNSYEWFLNETLPTIAAIDETSAMYSTAAARKSVTTYLSQAGGDIEVPVFSQSTQNVLMNLEAEEVTDLIRAAGRHISTQVIQGNYMTEANVTIYGTGIAATPGVNAVTAVSANMPTGLAGMTYTHAGTLLAFRAPGSTTYGTGVSIAAGDANYTFTDGDDSSKSVTLTIDASDYTTGAVNLAMHGALSFQRPEEMAGLAELAQLDSAQVVSSSGANGDAITLATLDQIEEMVLGDKSDKIFLCNARTRRAIKTLIAGAGGMMQGEYQGRDLSKYDLNYEGVPIVASPGVVITGAKGGSSTLGMVYCVRLNPAVGFHMYAANQASPNFGTATAVSDHDVEGGPAQVPGVFLRKLGEQENTATFKWRLTTALSGVLRRSTSCAVAEEISS